MEIVFIIVWVVLSILVGKYAEEHGESKGLIIFISLFTSPLIGFIIVNTLISSIYRDVVEMTQRVDRLGYAEQVSLLLPWTNGRKYPWLEWNAYALMCVGQAKMFVNQFRPGYYR